MRIHRLFTLLLPLALAACLSSTTDPSLATIETTTFAPALGVDIASSTRTASGAYYRDLVTGTGTTLMKGQTVAFYYDAYFPDGTHFQHLLAADASPPPNPYTFVLGTTDVITGLDEGMTGMQVGGKRQVVIPPSLAYGYGLNEVLIFNVEAVSAQ
jgi:FKBP-type peptidyl-prolyl cis-trans isomerase